MFPERAITSKYSLTQQSTHRPESPPDPEILEVGSEDCLYILWLSCDPDLSTKHHGGIRVAQFLETLNCLWEDVLGFEQSDLMLEIAVADYALVLRHPWCILAAMRF